MNGSLLRGQVAGSNPGGVAKSALIYRTLCSILRKAPRAFAQNSPEKDEISYGTCAKHEIPCAFWAGPMS